MWYGTNSTLTNGPLRILMLAPTPYFADRGCHVRIYEEAQALIGHGCDVRIVTYHIGRDMPGIPTERISHVPWYRRLTAGPSWQKPVLDILLYMKALSLSRTFRPQIIHAHLHEGAFIGMLLKPLLRIPLVLDYQGSLTAECRDHCFFSQGSLLERLFAAVEGIVNRAADAIVTSSSEGANLMVQSWNVPPQKVSAIIDGVDTKRFRPYPRQEARIKLGISDNVQLVVFLGLLNSYQGMDLLLEVMTILKTKKNQVHFLIMGYPEESYREKARELGLDSIVSFTGRIDYDEAAVYLSAGDLAISPKLSRTEANGKLFNYMACGLPTLVFDTPVNREILGEAGVYADYGDAADLAKRITELLNDSKQLAELSIALREKAVRDHSWTARATLIMAIYRRLIKSVTRTT